MEGSTSFARLARAFDLAARAHEGQRRGHGRHEAYINHVADVARRVAQSPEADETAVLAALLHDVAEKTSHDLHELRNLFGDEVARVVAELTDDEALPSGERHRQQVERAPTMSCAARRVKLADKASKLAEIIETPPRWWERAKARRDLRKAREVVEGLRGADPLLEAQFEQEATAADRLLGQRGRDGRWTSTRR